MKIECPNCHEVIVVGSLGRKPLDMPVIKVCDALRLHSSVQAAAESLGCSRGLVYKILKANGMTPADVMTGKRVDNR